uniref:Transcriptional regulator n=1 Tax=Ascaris lumbricoides TaxID=6252 RepID=A0A0M3HM96_ASCLU
MILKHADLPERTNTSLRWHLEVIFDSLIEMSVV